jgi:hypothetical protein
MKWKFVLALILVLILIPNVTALPSNFTLPTPGSNFSALNISYDWRTGTFTQYYANWSDGFPVYGFAYGILKPLMNFFGYWTFAIFWFLYLGISYLRTGAVAMPLAVGMISAPVFGLLFPGEAVVVGIVVFALASVVLLMKLFLKEREL